MKVIPLKELKPCPFCGSNDNKIEKLLVCTILCRNCRAVVSFAKDPAGDDPNAAIDAYNYRAMEGGGNGNK